MCACLCVCLFVCAHSLSRQVMMDLNTEPSQSEQQIVWDDPTARAERAKIADHMQWPGSPSQLSETLVAMADPTHPPRAADSMTDSELVEMGKKVKECIRVCGGEGATNNR